ncbi:hypothetical protein [Lacicoccus qingdaonensis]|uniref:hypothetical protein n=1 Tax=Lacicoccus qingdaonensis TaxID=576118 RepID=UPI000B815946|nr:hypothetical protein [Salinicoccus qingdaonensis]
MGETKWFWAILDGWTMTKRNFKHIFRNADSLLMSTPVENNLWLTITWFGGLLIVSFVSAIIVFKKRKNN